MKKLDYIMQIWNNQYDYGSINEFLKGKTKISRFNEEPFIFLEGQYFLSYEYEPDISLRWIQEKRKMINHKVVPKCEKVSLREYPDVKLGIEMDPELHSIIESDLEGSIDICDRSIFHPMFTYDKQKDLLCLLFFALEPTNIDPDTNRAGLFNQLGFRGAR